MLNNKVNIAVMVSGNGTNLQALIDSQKQGTISSGKISLVISNNKNAYAIERAKSNNIDNKVILKSDFTDEADFEDKLIETLNDYNIDLIVLAGFMCILSKKFTSKYKNKIINVHPSLIPSFCGKGHYGINVHKAALKKGVKITGATVHFVNEIPDGGQIIAQKAVEVEKNDTPETLQKKVMETCEWVILPKATEKICNKILMEKEG